MFSLKYLAFLLGVLVFLSASSLAEDVSDPSQDLATNKAGEELELKDLEEKLFLSTNTSSTSTTVSGAGIVWLLLWGVVFTIIGSAVLCYWVGCEYASTGRRFNDLMGLSFDPYAIDWEKFSILDWIAIGEEAWRKFDPADLECQKRLICEIHQNTSRFGSPAARLVDVFSYLQYAEVLSLPDEIKALIEDYNDAADRGRSLQKECGEIYQTCDFSVKKIMDKYSHNEV
ncbi:uncharacterized protein LOC122242637 isoform X4 [Penaeus japonicus]|uniref:uncharacterized protein LOC122242637 isoform X4 n=1 Tax=Penaeus japonicus TaxID=27405 RepID=UPI001C712183|nr:uncharacterized protein LOC122242637 isoform X4 [Penaeus japonicus]